MTTTLSTSLASRIRWRGNVYNAPSRAEELPEYAQIEAVDIYNRMHAGFRIRVEWGIGGWKRKWKRFIKRFDSTKPKFPHLFQAGCIMTNFLHRRRMEMNFEILGQGNEIGDGGWDGDC
jgi:hypothetical protein